MNNEEFGYQFINWQDIRNRVIKINRELAAIIDKISPNKHYPLILASYRFGDLIIKNGLLHLPKFSKLIPLNSAELESKLVKFLSYAKIPLTLLLNNACEIFVESNERTIPLNIFYQGKCFGTFETLSAIFNMECFPIWNVSAGGRTLFTLPKITESSGLKRLKNYYDLPTDLQVRMLSDHWQLFKEISQSSRFNQTWKQDLIFFTAPWFKNKKDPVWLEFKDYVFKQGWIQSQYAIANFEFSIFWQQFVKAIHQRNLKPSIYLSDTIKHLFAITAGAAPAFTPDDDSQRIAPTEALKQALLEVYQLKNYLPTFMHAGMLGNENLKTLYYSLNFPTLLEGTPEGKKELTLMFDLKEIKLMLETFQRFLTSENNLLSKINLNYFHVQEDKNAAINSSKVLVKFDKSLLLDQKSYYEREFCATSQFWRGCIQIAK